MIKKVLIFIVSYNAEQFIESVLERIPAAMYAGDTFETEVLVIDDKSDDQTVYRAIDFGRRKPHLSVTVLHNPENQGYGGNQKVGYHYAIQNGFDVVVLLHGDGQYAPELLPDMVQPILNGEADVVFGSRMMNKSDALKGRMPLYKWVGNQVLTFIQNWLLGSKLSEFHTGYRAYSVGALKSVPFMFNADYFDFDTDIIIQMLDTGKRIIEIPIPTYYGDEISRVNGIRYGILILKSTLLSRIVPRGIYYHPKFDYHVDNSFYTFKLGFPSSHTFALERVKSGSTVLDVGCGPGFMAQYLAQQDVRTISLDRFILPMTEQYSFKTIEADVDEYDFTADDTKTDTVLVLDIIEHLKDPEGFLKKLRIRYARDDTQVIITTGNIAFIIIRLSLLLGQFNYGKRGILDLDHTRLYTFGSMRRLLRLSGYDVVEEKGIPAPFPLAVGDGLLGRLLLNINRILIWLSRSLFAYQMAFVARPRLTLDHLLENAERSAEEKRQSYLAESNEILEERH